MPNLDPLLPSRHEQELFAALRRGIGLAAVLVGAVMAAGTLAAAPLTPTAKPQVAPACACDCNCEGGALALAP